MPEYSRDYMLSEVKKYFSKKHYTGPKYSDEYDIRVPLYCESENKRTEEDDVFVDYTTSGEITKDVFFAPKKVETRKKNGKPEFRKLIFSPLLFYQYYFPSARVFYAIPDYAIHNHDKICVDADGTCKDTCRCKDFADFVSYCEEQKIGLLKVYGINIKNKTEKLAVKEILPATPLSKRFSEEIIRLCKEYENEAKKEPKSNKTYKQHIAELARILAKIDKKTQSYLHSALDYFVYYAHPEFKRRSIVGRINLISLFLIEKMEELKKITFLKELQEFSDSYRHAEVSDYDIASDYVNRLWKKHLNLNYPPAKIQERFEEIFLTNPRYREHFVHQFQVFLLGSLIIDKLYSSKKAVFDDFLKRNGDPLEKAWLATSTYHDYNFSTQKYNEWLGKYLEEILQLSPTGKSKKALSKLNLEIAVVREKILFTSEKIMKSNINCKQYEGIREKLNLFLYEKIVSERNHGLISSFTLLKRYSAVTKPKIKRKSIEEAALAIALHDKEMWEYFCGCRGFLLGRQKKCDDCSRNSDCEDWAKAMMKCKLLPKIGFAEYPRLYLLILCDSCQDEGRVMNPEGIKTSIKDVNVSANGEVTMEIEAEDEDAKEPISYDSKSAEFECLREFLKDGNFKIILKAKGKEPLEFEL